MKKSIIRLVSILIFETVMLSCSILSATAAETALVSGVEIPVGDTFTYTFNISDADQKIVGMQINLFFDQDVLELVAASDGVLDGTSTINDNQNKDGRITVVNPFMNGGGLNCKDATVVATATFKVLSAEETDITYFVEYLYDIDMVDIHTYTFTCDFLSRETVISQGDSPVLADKSIRDDLTGDDTFRNNEEGKGDGEERDPAFDVTQQIPTETPSLNETQETNTTETQTRDEDTSSSADSDENETVTRDKKEKSGHKDDDSDVFVLILIGAVSAVAVVAAGIVILKKTGKKK